MKLAVAATCSTLLRFSAASYYSPKADVTPFPNIDIAFQHPTARNHELILKAINVVASLQTAPTCTRMAASDLIKECRLLEDVPDPVKTHPDAYLEEIRKEYAAKLAVCEWLSAQPPGNAIPPLHCHILVPSHQACNKRGWWSRKTTNPDKLCYPEYTKNEYDRCFETLRTTTQYWTSLSNARQSAVALCQASRSHIELEYHLEIFKNLTQVMGDVSSALEHTTNEYAFLLHEQKQFADELREAQIRFKDDMSAAQEKAVATVTDLDDRFHNFMHTSISQVIAALADGQSAELARIRENMHLFSQNMIDENIQLAKALTTELQQHHDRAIISLGLNHQAQLNSHEVLSGYMRDITDVASNINSTSGSSLTIIGDIEHRLNSLSSKAENIARGFAFVSNLSRLVTSFVQSLIAMIGAIFLLIVLYRFSTRLATYLAGACSAAYFLHVCGLYQLLDESQRSPSILNLITNLDATQKGVGLVMIIWLATYPVSRISAAINDIFVRILRSYWVREYRNEGGAGYLLSVEVPHYAVRSKVNALEQGIANGYSRRNNQGYCAE